MNRELAAWTQLTRRLPRVRGAGHISQWVWQVYKRKPRPHELADVLGLCMELDPHQVVDGILLLAPQLFDYVEISFLQRHLRSGDTFLDAGAYVGMYALTASRLVGSAGSVVAVEASPDTYRRLTAHVAWNRAENVQTVHGGLSDQDETLPLALHPSDAGSNTFLADTTGPTVTVPCRPLLPVLQELGVQHLTGAKFDVEGFEYRVLRCFLADAPPSLWPGFVILEWNHLYDQDAGGNAVDLLLRNGYSRVWSHGLNHILIR